jgi:hypothetical protein
MTRAYVYRCEHKVTKKFYIGYREANYFPANLDFGTHYFTSSEEVSKNFADYTYRILAEFNNPKTAFEIEQTLIYESRNNPLLINQHWKTTVVYLDPSRDLRFFLNHRVRYDKATGNPYLAKNKKKKKKIRVPTTVERLGRTNAEFKLRNEQRRERRAQKKAL